MRKIINGQEEGFQSVDGSTYFPTLKALQDAVIAGTAAAGPWIPVITIKTVEVE
jgi:hypothetical protein